MANAKSSIILDEGLNEIHNGTVGSYFALKYWLPMYDPRLDNEIHGSTQASTTASGTDVYPLSGTLSATHEYADLEGEKLFNADSSEYQTHLGVSVATDVYTLPTTLNYVISGSPNIPVLGTDYTGAVSNDTSSVSNSSQRNGVKANLINSISSISQVLSATTLSADANGLFSGTGIGAMNQITEIGYAKAGGLNTSAVGLLYPVNSFSSMVVSGNNIDAGRYNVRLEAHGDFRFNKFVLFVAKMNSDGTEDTSYLPKPFSVSVFEGTTEKLRTTSDGTGLQWEGIIQLAFQRDPAQNNLTNLVIANWTDLGLSEFTLATNKKVHIFDAGYDVSGTGAKLTITDDTIAQLRLGYNLNNVTNLTTCADGHLEISASDGQVELKVGAGTSGTADSYADDFVINSDDDCGITILTPDNKSGSIYFGKESDPNVGSIYYNHSAGMLIFGAGGGSKLTLTSTLFTVLTSASFNQDVTFNDKTFFNDVALMTIGAGTSGTAYPTADDFVINSDDSAGITILTPDNKLARINFGYANEQSNGYIHYNHNTDTFEIGVGDDTKISQTTTLLYLSTSAMFNQDVTFNDKTFLNDVALMTIGASTTGTADVGADDFVIKSDADAGISITTPSGNIANIHLGDHADPDAGRISFNNFDDSLTILGKGDIKFAPSDAVRLTLTSTLFTIATSASFNQDVTFNDKTFFNDVALMTIGAGTSGTAYPTADDFVINSDDSAGITILTPDDKLARINFGKESDPSNGYIHYNHGVDRFEIGVGDDTKISQTTTLLTLYSSATFNQDVTFSDNVYFNNPVTIDSTLSATGAVTFDSTLDVAGYVTLTPSAFEYFHIKRAESGFLPFTDFAHIKNMMVLENNDDQWIQFSSSLDTAGQGMAFTTSAHGAWNAGTFQYEHAVIDADSKFLFGVDNHGIVYINKYGIEIRETSTIPSDHSGYGQFFTSSDDGLYFKNGSGVVKTVTLT